MFPYTYDYDPSMPQYAYGMPYRPRRDPHYLHALAEEEAARRQYEQALRQQEEARTRAARARLARQAYEQPAYNSYLADDADDDYGLLGAPRRRGYAYDYPYLAPQEQRALQLERARMDAERREQQRRLEALERERELERQRIRALEEERRRRLLEEERRRRIMLEEEERQRRREEERLRREEEEYLRRASPQAASPFLPLEELLGLRPSRSLEPELNNSRRARTMSPANRTRTPHTAPQAPRSQSKAPAPAARSERASSRPRPEPQAQSHRIPISSPRSSPKPSPKTTPAPPQEPKPQTPPPRTYTPAEIDAAAKIQAFWRAHHQRRASLAAIAALGTEFTQLKSSFALPPALDYTLDGTHVSVPTTSSSNCALSPDSAVERREGDAPLAFTPANAPLHAYEEALNRLLTRLDGVPSGGDGAVRARRRALARAVEREAQRVEGVKVRVWRAWVAREGRERGEGMQVDEDAPAGEPAARSEEESSESRDIELADDAPANANIEAPTAHADAEEMDVEPSTTHLEPASAAPADTSNAPHEPAEPMDVEPSSEDIVVEPADTLPADADVPSDVPVPIIVEEPDPDADEPAAQDEQREEGEEEEVRVEVDADDVVEAVPDEEPTEFMHAPLTASVLAASPPPSLSPEASLSLENSSSPSTLSDTQTPHAPDATSAPPPLVHAPSSASDSDHTPPHTPPALHEALAAPPALASEQVATDKLATEKISSEKVGSERLQMLRPLVSAEWDEAGDLF